MSEAVRDYRLLVAGEWVDGGSWHQVRSPYNGEVVGRVPLDNGDLVNRAVASAREALSTVEFPQAERAAVLERAASLLKEQREGFARTIALEAGKPLKQARAEVERAAGTLTFSSVECRKLVGEMVPMEATAMGAGKIGMVLRLPVGVVGAITPFNFPLNLVCHKLGPAIAAGNTVVQKPASQTPLSSLKLAELLIEAGLPPAWLNVICGGGSQVGGAIVEHEDIDMITFTGSAEVGWAIRSKAPRKKVSLELGSTAPLIVNDDGDWELAADKAAIHAYSFAGQSCISTQRILVHEKVAEGFIKRLVDRVGELKVGDPLDEGTDVGPVIDEANRMRIMDWIEEARAGGAEIATGGGLTDDGLIEPTVVVNPDLKASVYCKEVFGPVATVHSFKSFDEGLDMANDSQFGLQAGVFTSNLGNALKAAKTLDFGGVLVNEVPTYRLDQQPYGGVKQSGNTREGPAYAIREMTEERFISLQGG